MTKASPALILFTAFAVAVAVAPTTARAQKAIFLVRHAEKVDESKDPALSTAGLARAQALANHLRDAGVSAIFTSEYARTRATAAPLAAAVKVVPQVVAAKDSEALIKAVKARVNDVVLIVGHSDTLPKLLAALGVQQPIEIAHSEYDDLFLVVPGPTPSAPPTLLRLRY